MKKFQAWREVVADNVRYGRQSDPLKEPLEVWGKASEMVRCGNQLTTQKTEEQIKKESETMRLTYKWPSEHEESLCPK